MLSILKSHGYALTYFSGSNLEFDHQGDYLRSEGVERLYSQKDFTPSQRKGSEWGYPDSDLFDFATTHLVATASHTPTLSIVQTMSMHTPFQFPEIDVYRHKVDQRLDALGIPKDQRQIWHKDRDIYASILYTDDAIRHFMQALEKQPQWRNTVVVITGDHRLPEITMDTKLERYHVPLIIASPMLKSAQHIQSMSSHLDIAPSVVAMLSHQYDWKTPATVSWMSTGLDTEPSFRNVHAIALKQTKTSLHDYVSGLYFLNEDQLFEINDRLEPAPVRDATLSDRLHAELDTLSASLLTLDVATRLTPASSVPELVSYVETDRTLLPRQPLAQLSGVVVSGLSVEVSHSAQLVIQATFDNHASTASATFVPLAVLSDATGKEIAEVSAAALELAASGHKSMQVTLDVPSVVCPPQRCFVSMVVSDPQTGKSIGHGQYHVEVRR
jgi:uncharacterized sulfatase